jgi:hypothetical protein
MSQNEQMRKIQKLLTEARVEGMIAQRDYMLEEMWQMWGGGDPPGESVHDFLCRVGARFAQVSK